MSDVSTQGPVTVTGYVVSGDFLLTYYKNVVARNPNLELPTIQIGTAIAIATKHIGTETGITCLHRQFIWQSRRYMLCVYEDDPYSHRRGCLKRSDVESDPAWVVGLPLFHKLLVEHRAIQQNERMSDYQVFRRDREPAVAAQVSLLESLQAKVSLETHKSWMTTLITNVETESTLVVQS